MGGLEDDDVRGFSMLAREHCQSGRVSSCSWVGMRSQTPRNLHSVRGMPLRSQ